jgi:hypothetical protein
MILLAKGPTAISVLGTPPCVGCLDLEACLSSYRKGTEISCRMIHGIPIPTNYSQDRVGITPPNAKPRLFLTHEIRGQEATLEDSVTVSEPFDGRHT